VVRGVGGAVAGRARARLRSFARPVLDPGTATTRGATWDVGTGHFAERFGLFVVLALGESIVLTGATTSESSVIPAMIVAFVMAFLTSTAIWWLYLTSVARPRGALPRGLRRPGCAR
jgi:low temperature requirement protein LtrA